MSENLKHTKMLMPMRKNGQNDLVKEFKEITKTLMSKNLKKMTKMLMSKISKQEPLRWRQSI